MPEENLNNPAQSKNNRYSLQSIGFLALAIALASLALTLFHASNEAAQANKETAYERVIRTQTLHCGYFLWQPFVTQNVNTKELGGFEYEYVNAVGKSLGLKVTWTELLQGQQVEALRAGKIDAVCDDGPFLMTEGAYVQYAEPMFYEEYYLYVRADDHRFDDDIRKASNPNVTIAAMDGDITLDLAMQSFPNVKLHQLSNAADPTQLFMDVVYRKADIVINDAISAANFLKNNPGTIRRVSVKKPIAYLPDQISVLRGEGDLADMISQGVLNVRARGIEEVIFSRVAPEYQDSIHRAALPYNP
jgi:ABC-type amino acid transport substrate-binding protein